MCHVIPAGDAWKSSFIQVVHKHQEEGPTFTCDSWWCVMWSSYMDQCKTVSTPLVFLSQRLRTGLFTNFIPSNSGCVQIWCTSDHNEDFFFFFLNGPNFHINKNQKSVPSLFGQAAAVKNFKNTTTHWPEEDGDRGTDYRGGKNPFVSKCSNTDVMKWIQIQ